MKFITIVQATMQVRSTFCTKQKRGVAAYGAPFMHAVFLVASVMAVASVLHGTHHPPPAPKRARNVLRRRSVSGMWLGAVSARVLR